MRSMLIGWDHDGNVVRSISEVIALDEAGEVVGHIDFEAHELAGGSMTDIVVFGAVAVDVLPPLPDPMFQPVSDDPDARPSRVLFLLPERQVYRNRDGAWVAEPHPTIAGAGTWPEFLADPCSFRVDLRPGPKGGSHRVRALVHRVSGHRRDRAALGAEVQRRVDASLARVQERRAERARVVAARGDADGHPPTDLMLDAIEPEPVDVGDLFGGPDHPIRVDADGRTVEVVRRRGPRTRLPVVGGSGQDTGDQTGVLAAMEAARPAPREPGKAAG